MLAGQKSASLKSTQKIVQSERTQKVVSEKPVISESQKLVDDKKSMSDYSEEEQAKDVEKVSVHRSSMRQSDKMQMQNEMSDYSDDEKNVRHEFFENFKSVAVLLLHPCDLGLAFFIFYQNQWQWLHLDV